MAGILGAILKLSPMKRALASEQVRSRYLETLSRRHRAVRSCGLDYTKKPTT